MPPIERLHLKEGVEEALLTVFWWRTSTVTTNPHPKSVLDGGRQMEGFRQWQSALCLLLSFLYIRQAFKERKDEDMFRGWTI
ncbi:hypothetical protein WAI453_005244 [Rhynchosporium graminicola]